MKDFVIDTKGIARSIERDVKSRWGWEVKVAVSQSGDVSWDGNREKNRDRYDMYPELTKEEADQRVMDEILSIIRRYLPGFVYTSYEQSGVLHYPQAG